MQALEMLTNAISIDPKNPLARFQKAQVLLSTDQYELALTELKQLVEMAPKEGSVYFVLGKVRPRCPQSRSLIDD
jgi:anaphase-promoting complex subunit 3